MDRKQIVFTAPGTAELLQTPMPELKPGQILVKMAVSTISSGTERALLTGNRNTDCTKPPKDAVFPRSTGYSSAGTVVALGEGVTDLEIGDRVAMIWSTHSSILPINRKQVIKIDDLPFEEAALWHIATFPLAAIRKCRLEIGESAMVMGQGVLGMMAVQLLRAAGAAPILAVDPVPEKREHALAIGADYALDPFDPDFAKTVKEITGGGAKVCIEVTGNGKGLDGALDCMARFGRVALLGCTRSSDFTIDYYRKVHGPGITLIGAHTKARPETDSAPGWWTAMDDMKALKTLCQTGRIRFQDLIEESHSPTEATEVYARLCQEKFFPLVQFDWRKL